MHALEAENEDAYVVLGDMALEQGWDDARVPFLTRATPRLERSGFWYCTCCGCRRDPNLKCCTPSAPTRQWVSALVAVHLFGDWNSDMWPVAKRCVVDLTFVSGAALDAFAADVGLGRRWRNWEDPTREGASRRETDQELRTRLLASRPGGLRR